MGNKTYICFSASSHMLARLFRKILKSDINHCFLLYDSVDWGGPMAVEIDYRGVHIFPAEAIIGPKDHIEFYECLGDVSPGLLANRKRIGQAYDWLGLFWGLLRTKLFDWFGIDAKLPIYRRNKMFCSRFVSVVLKDAELTDLEGKDPYSISPPMLRSILSRNNNFQKVARPV